MRFFFKSICTFSFWRYALFSAEAAAKILACVGALYSFLEVLDFFSIYTRDKYSAYAVLPLFLCATVYVVVTRRPITKFVFKVPNKDFAVEVRIGDIFDGTDDVVVSSNTTFDTDIASGLIAIDSLQGQVATRFFQSNTVELDRQLRRDLEGVPCSTRVDAPGNKQEYPLGTVARARAFGRTFYFVAMSRLSAAGTAGSTLRDVEDALDSLWRFILRNGELHDLAVPLMGTGRGRTGITRKKMSERIAHSFYEASLSGTFSNKLSIVIRHEDAENFGVNLYQIRDYLVHGINP